jgi:hypothetical protein
MNIFDKILVKHVMFILLTINGLIIYSQELSNIKENKPFEWDGNLNLGFNSFHSTQNNNYSANSFYIGAQLNFKIYGINMPFSMVYRDRSSNFDVPFSRFSFSPSYKWIKLHLGHNSINMNPYVLSGIQIYGAGLELNPGKLRFSIIKGEIKNTKLIVDTLDGHSGVLNPFKRDVLAIKLGLGTDQNHFELQLLTGKDKTRLNQIYNDSLFNKLEANTTLGATYGLSLFKRRLSIKFNGAASAYTHNLNGKEFSDFDLNSSSAIRTANSIIDINYSTSMSFAGDVSLRLNLGNLYVGGKYQMIDPFYQSFGVFFMRGDNINYSLNFGYSFWQNKVQINGTYGINRNNIHGQRNNNTKQSIYNLNLNLSPFTWLGMDLQFSNFNFDQSPVITSLNDSLRVIQVNKTTSLNPYVMFKSKQIRHNLNFQYSKQSILDLSGFDISSGDSYVTSIGIGYNLNNKTKKYGMNTQLFYISNAFSNVLTRTTGLSIGFNKSSFNDKLNNRIRISYSSNVQNEKNHLAQYNISLNSAYNVGKKGSISLSAMFGKRPNYRTQSLNSDTRLSLTFNLRLK